MGERLKNIRLQVKGLGFYIPVTFYFGLFAVACFIGYKWLHHKAGIPDSAYGDIFRLLLRFSAVFCLAFIIVGSLSVLVPFAWFIFKKRKQDIRFRISTPSRSDAEYDRQPMSIHISPILRPLLGFIKVRLKYDEEHFSEKFSLIKRSQKKIFSTDLDATWNWELPEIKEYRIEKAIIYFEDFFQFFSLAVPLVTSSEFHTYPLSRNTRAVNAFPRKTEETSLRIEEIKKVEGELINYKNFESNDDVRRIVWKIYAKNKELVVRIPEILDPYASHLYMYSSFYSVFDIENNDALQVPFLNYYKTICWSVYRQLGQKGFEVRYIADQDIPRNKMEDDAGQVRYAISVSKWHRERELRDQVKPKDASVVVISSLSDPEQVEQLLEIYGNDIAFVFVPVSEGMSRQHLGDWLQWLFVQQEKDSMAVYRTSWSLSLLRLKILRNEKRLKELLDRYERSVVMEKKNSVS